MTVKDNDAEQIESPREIMNWKEKEGRRDRKEKKRTDECEENEVRGKANNLTDHKWN